MKHRTTLAAAALGVAILGGWADAGRVADIMAGRAAGTRPSTVPATREADAKPVVRKLPKDWETATAEPLRWRVADGAPAWALENVARFERERTAGLDARRAALKRFRKDAFAKGTPDDRKQLAIGEERFANLLSGDGVPPITFAPRMDPKEYAADGPAFGSCYVVIVKVLGPDKAVCDVTIGAVANGAPGSRRPQGDVSGLPVVRGVVKHAGLASLREWFKPGQGTGCTLEKAGTVEMDGVAYPYFRYPDITPFLVPAK